MSFYNQETDHQNINRPDLYQIIGWSCILLSFISFGVWWLWFIV